MKQGIYNWPDLPSGNTMPGQDFAITFSGGAPANLSAVRIAFYRDGVTALEKTNGDGITITDAEAWQFSFAEVAASETAIDPGIYRADIETTDAAGEVKTYVTGTLAILETAPPSP